MIAVGTTVVRSLESAMRDGELQPFAGETQIFILPGYSIRSVDAMVTNFHLPESTLLMMVSAFAGRERIFEAYRHAIAQRYRFFSYGDAMLLWTAQARRKRPRLSPNSPHGRPCPDSSSNSRPPMATPAAAA